MFFWLFLSLSVSYPEVVSVLEFLKEALRRSTTYSLRDDNELDEANACSSLSVVSESADDSCENNCDSLSTIYIRKYIYKNLHKEKYYDYIYMYLFVQKFKTYFQLAKYLSEQCLRVKKTKSN